MTRIGDLTSIFPGKITRMAISFYWKGRTNRLIEAEGVPGRPRLLCALLPERQILPGIAGADRLGPCSQVRRFGLALCCGKQDCVVLQQGSDLGVIGSWHVFEVRQRTLKERLRLIVASLLQVAPPQLMQSVPDVGVLRPHCLLIDREGTPVEAFGLGVVARRLVDDAEMVQRDSRPDGSPEVPPTAAPSPAHLRPRPYRRPTRAPESSGLLADDYGPPRSERGRYSSAALTRVCAPPVASPGRHADWHAHVPAVPAISHAPC
jgi:hypothetical protein